MTEALCWAPDIDTTLETDSISIKKIIFKKRRIILLTLIVFLSQGHIIFIKC